MSRRLCLDLLDEQLGIAIAVEECSTSRAQLIAIVQACRRQHPRALIALMDVLEQMEPGSLPVLKARAILEDMTALGLLSDADRRVHACPRPPGVLPPMWGRVPNRNKEFVGRDMLLLQLRADLHRSGSHDARVLFGSGGVGKTALVTEYAWRFANDYDAVCWVNAEKAELIADQFATFAAAGGLANGGAQVEPAVDALRAYCRSRGRWLLVLDNAISARSVRDWIPAGPGHVLITSRDPHWTEISATIEVGLFARTESTTLLQTILACVTDEQADRLAGSLGDLPLAIAQAAGMLSVTGMPVTDYLELLRVAPVELLDTGAPISYPWSLVKTIEISADRLATSDPTALHLLRLCSFFASEPIPTRWLTKFYLEAFGASLRSDKQTVLSYRLALAALNRFGLIKFTDDRIVMHRLTRTIMQARTSHPERYIDIIVALLVDNSPRNSHEPSLRPSWAELLPHLICACIEYREYDRLHSIIDRVFDYLSWRGDLRTAAYFAKDLYSLIVEQMGRTHEKALEIAYRVASLEVDLGNYAAALPISKEVYNHWKNELGPDDTSVLGHANLLAYVFHAVGDLDSAQELNTDTYARRSTTLGACHPDTLNSAGNLASDLHALGRLADARDLASTTLEIAQTNYGENHVQSCRAASNLACILSDLRNIDTAAELNRKTLAIRCNTLGPDHPHTLRTANNLAADLAELRQYAEAQELALDVLTRRRRALPQYHPHTLSAELNLEIINTARTENATPIGLARQRT